MTARRRHELLSGLGVEREPRSREVAIERLAARPPASSGSAFGQPAEHGRRLERDVRRSAPGRRAPISGLRTARCAAWRIASGRRSARSSRARSTALTRSSTVAHRLRSSSGGTGSIGDDHREAVALLAGAASMYGTVSSERPVVLGQLQLRRPVDARAHLASASGSRSGPRHRWQLAYHQITNRLTWSMSTLTPPFSDEHEELRQSIRGFIERELAPHARAVGGGSLVPRRGLRASSPRRACSG